MKKLLLLCFVVLFSFVGISQSLKESGEFNEYLKLPHTKKEAYLSVLVWLSENFNDSNSAIKLRDQDLGLIIAKGVFDEHEFTTSFTIRFKFTESKCMVKLKNFKELQYNYSYRSSECYTKSCKKNLYKWKNSVKKSISNLLNQIAQETGL